MTTSRHPLHPAVVHFPLACWSLATFADIASLWLGRPAWWLAGVLLAIGALAGLAAMATGLVEFVRIPAGSPALRDANRHVLLVMAAWILYAGSLFLRLRGTTLVAPGWAALATGIAGLFCLGAAGWMGGKLVYQHRIGGGGS